MAVVKLNHRTERILDAIEAYWQAHRRQPTIRQVCSMTGIQSTSIVQHHVRLLQQLGRLTEDRVPPKGRCRELLGHEDGLDCEG